MQYPYNRSLSEEWELFFWGEDSCLLRNFLRLTGVSNSCFQEIVKRVSNEWEQKALLKRSGRSILVN